VFQCGTVLAPERTVVDLQGKVSYVELDSLLRDWPRLLRLVRARLDVPPLPRLRAPLPGVGSLNQTVAHARRLIDRVDTALVGWRQCPGVALLVALQIPDTVTPEFRAVESSLTGWRHGP
jgi:hypothetical protein